MKKSFMPKIYALCLLAVSLFSCKQSAAPQPDMLLRQFVPAEHILIGATVNQWQVAADLGLTDHPVDGSYALVGNRDQVMMEAALVPHQFNCITSENCLKSEIVAPEKGVWDFVLGDQFVAYAQKHHLTVIGHSPIWHSQCAKWITRDEEGNLVDEATLRENIRLYITTVYQHFRGQIKGYDVVNEAIEEDGSYRQSDFYRIMGEEFIDWAFQCAMEADPDAELYYNDYSMAAPGKRATVVAMIERLKSKGIRIDAVGLQTHIGMDFPEMSEYEASMEAFIAAGVDVQLTETDISILPNPYAGADVATRLDYTPEKDPYVDGVPAEALHAWQARYKALFDVVNRHADHVRRVTFWGVTDASSWKNDFPIPGRTDYPLPFDRQGMFKL